MFAGWKATGAHHDSAAAESAPDLDRPGRWWTGGGCSWGIADGFLDDVDVVSGSKCIVSGAQGIEAKKRLAELTDGTDQLLGTGQEGEGTHGNATADKRKSSTKAQKNEKKKEARNRKRQEKKEAQRQTAVRERCQREASRVAFFDKRRQEQQLCRERQAARVAAREAARVAARNRNRQITEQT
jgi:hypothetical protein